VVILAVVAWVYIKKRRSDHLRSHFGSEYERTVAEFGSHRRAEDELARREERINSLRIRPLTFEERQHFGARWSEVQGRFVDEPSLALLEADQLVTEVMSIRGYPTGTFGERLDDVSGAYPNIAGNYRQACAIVRRQDSGDITTEDRRRAMVLYRDLFDELFREDEGNEKLRRAS
jgi:hypothetical protein